MTDDAHELRRQLVELSRREAELEALYETAGDLSSLHDLESVLTAIVGRARALLHTDTGYIGVIDEERQETYLRAHDGIRSERFINGRLALGSGLAGLVASSGEPHHTADYLADTRFDHSVDDLVRGEGLVAIQGVPLKLGDKVIGVLLAADRRERSFTPHEVALLISLADHAAIAIETASLFEEVRSTVEQLTRANAAIEAAAALHDRLSELVLGGGGLTEIAAAVGEELGGELTVLDAQGKVIAGDGSYPSEAGQALKRPDWTRSQALPPDSCATPIIAGGELLGALVLTGPEPTEFVVRALERAALVTALRQLNDRSLAEAEHRLRGEILEDLLTARNSEGLRRRAALLGLDLDEPHSVMVAGSRDREPRRNLSDAAAALAAREKGMAGEHAGRVVLLIPGDPDPQLYATVLSERTGRCVSVGAASSQEGIVKAYRDATRCLDVLLALDRDGQGATLGSLGIYGLLFTQTSLTDLEHFIEETIGPVLAYDAAKGGELFRTLEAYFRCDGNLARTASALYVHVNTLYQRLDRIGSLLDPGWRTGDKALQIHLALKLRATTA